MTESAKWSRRIVMALITMCCGSGVAMANERSDTVVRMAEIEVDVAQVDAYREAVKEEMADSVRLEPGVLAIYCVAEKGASNRFRFFEMYASDAAYRSHLQSPHFRKYVTTTESMIKSRNLIETVPVQLTSK